MALDTLAPYSVVLGTVCAVVGVKIFSCTVQGVLGASVLETGCASPLVAPVS